jgi:peptidoglycan/LPS O-acetylase OafA/YrhL
MSRFPWIPPLSESLATAILIAGSSLNPASALTAPLSFRPLVWLGNISYSAYLWQQIFTLPLPLPMRVAMIFVLFPAFVLLTNYCIERPLTRFGHGITTKAAKGWQDFHSQSSDSPGLTIPAP